MLVFSAINYFVDGAIFLDCLFPQTSISIEPGVEVEVTIADA